MYHIDRSPLPDYESFSFPICVVGLLQTWNLQTKDRRGMGKTIIFTAVRVCVLLTVSLSSGEEKV